MVPAARERRLSGRLNHSPRPKPTTKAKPTPTSPATRRIFFFLMLPRPPRYTRVRSSAASDVYKRQLFFNNKVEDHKGYGDKNHIIHNQNTVSYTHLRAHETPEHLVCRLLLASPRTPEHLVCRLLLENTRTPEHLVCRLLI